MSSLPVADDEVTRDDLRGSPLTYRDEERILDAGDDLDAACARVAADKIAIDLAYFEQATPMGDLRVIGRTVKAVLSRS